MLEIGGDAYLFGLCNARCGNVDLTEGIQKSLCGKEVVNKQVVPKVARWRLWQCFTEPLYAPLGYYHPLGVFRPTQMALSGHINDIITLANKGEVEYISTPAQVVYLKANLNELMWESLLMPAAAKELADSLVNGECSTGLP